MFQCTSCNQSKSESEFHNSSLIKVKRSGSTTISKCKSCAKSYQIKWNAARKARHLSRSLRPLNLKKIGRIYVIGVDKRNGCRYFPVKIGNTVDNINRRLSSIQTGHWMDLKVVLISKLLNDVENIERQLHDRFQDKRVRGEWFDLSESDIKTIKQIVG